MHIIVHRLIYCVDFGEFRINSFLQEYKKLFLYITAYGVKFFKRSSIQMIHSIDLKFGMHIISHRRTNPIDFGEHRMNNFFYRSTKKNSYTLRPMEPNSLKCSSIQMIRSIDLKFGIYIIGHRSTNYIDFGE